MTTHHHPEGEAVTKSHAAIVAKFSTKQQAARATLEEQRDRVRRDLDHGTQLTETAASNLMLAEGVMRRYNDLGTNADGTLYRPDGEDDETTVKRLRTHRRNLIRKLLFTPEAPWPGFAAAQQHYDREGAKRFLSETAFVSAGDDLPTSTDQLLEQAKSLPAEFKIKLVEAMGFKPVGSAHAADCPAMLDSGNRHNCVPPATMWSAPRDVQEERGETWEQRLQRAREMPDDIREGVTG